MKYKLNLEEDIDLEEDIIDSMGRHRTTIGNKKVYAYGDMWGDTIEQVLNDKLRINEKYLKIGDYEDVLNVLIIGKGGTGKTSQVRSWARKNNLNILFFNGSQLRKDTMQGPPHAEHDTLTLDDGTEKEITVSKRLSPSDFKPLDRERSVFIIDEINRSMSIDRGSILEMVEDRTLPDDNYPDGRKPLKNLIMTVAMMNPATRSYAGAEPLDDAMLGRFILYIAESDTEKVTTHIMQHYNNNIKNVKNMYSSGELNQDEYNDYMKTFNGIKQIAKLIMDAGIDINTSEDDIVRLNKEGKPSLSNRTYSKALKDSEGDPKKFLRSVCSTAGLSENPDNVDENTPKNVRDLVEYNNILHQFKSALEGYVDIDDVENSVMNGDNATLWDKTFAGLSGESF